MIYMNNFIYDVPTKVYFGKDEELKVGKIVAEFDPHKVLSVELPNIKLVPNLGKTKIGKNRQLKNRVACFLCHYKVDF